MHLSYPLACLIASLGILRQRKRYLADPAFETRVLFVHCTDAIQNFAGQPTMHEIAQVLIQLFFEGVLENRLDACFFPAATLAHIEQQIR